MATYDEESQTALRNIVGILDAIRPGADIYHVFHEIGRAIGTAKVAIRRPPCTQCDGDGFEGRFFESCPKCGGSGREPEAAALRTGDN